ncbi:MAG: hypothetical protein LUQ67_02435 [Methanomicrobiales archaeon]|nr:hypothetical protein [Methanomicrobiales archaeon]
MNYFSLAKCASGISLDSIHASFPDQVRAWADWVRQTISIARMSADIDTREAEGLPTDPEQGGTGGLIRERNNK